MIKSTSPICRPAHKRNGADLDDCQGGSKGRDGGGQDRVAGFAPENPKSGSIASSPLATPTAKGSPQYRERGLKLPHLIAQDVPSTLTASNAASIAGRVSSHCLLKSLNSTFCIGSHKVQEFAVITDIVGGVVIARRQHQQHGIRIEYLYCAHQHIGGKQQTDVRPVERYCSRFSPSSTTQRHDAVNANQELMLLAVGMFASDVLARNAEDQEIPLNLKGT